MEKSQTVDPTKTQLPTGQGVEASPKVDGNDYYILWFRYGSNPHTQPKHFRHPGSFQDAIMRGKSHCEKMGLRFIKVEKFFTDLAEEERVHMQMG